MRKRYWKILTKTVTLVVVHNNAITLCKFAVNWVQSVAVSIIQLIAAEQKSVFTISPNAITILIAIVMPKISRLNGILV